MHCQRVIFGDDKSSASTQAKMSVDVFFPDHGYRHKAAFVFHGRNGASDAPHMMKVITAYTVRDYIVFSPNLCNSEWNDSAGDGMDFTIEHHVRDARRCIDWVLRESGALNGSCGRFALCGHSMGGYAALYLAATDFRLRTDHVLAAAPVISGASLIEARRRYHPDGIETLRREVPAALEEWPRYDLYRVAGGLTMPVSAVVGADDNLTLPCDIEPFLRIVPGRQEFCVIEGEHHCLIGETISDVFGQRIDRLEAASRFTARPAFTTVPSI